MNRREFVNYTGALMSAGLGSWNEVPGNTNTDMDTSAKITIAKTDCNFEREPLFPYSFKGSVIREGWQIVSYLESSGGTARTGIGGQGILWSDSKVFADHSVSGGNALMFAMTDHALQLMKGMSFSDPLQLLDELLPEVYKYGQKITGNPQLRKTFALNALVSVDNAAWLLYAAENGFKNFDQMIPQKYRPGLSYRHKKVASMPSFSVGADINKIKAAADEGYFMLKLKIGSPGSQQEMLQKDMEFIAAVHQAIGHYETEYTANGKIPYYFDANERYDKKETMMRLLDHAKKIGAFDQIALIEEPFGERNTTFVGDLGVMIAADESAHTVEDAVERIEQGYTAMAVKAVAKTLSMTMKITQAAYEKNVPCFCADLTVNPILVDWNKNVAARLQPFANFHVGLLEANGRQYYKNWEKMMAYHPKNNGSWIHAKKGVFETDDSFYEQSAGIFEPSPHYSQLSENGRK